MRGDEDIEQAMSQHGNDVLRACLAYLPQRADAEDAFQDTFVRYATSNREFVDGEHRKAWLLRVAANVCKDHLKAAPRRNVGLDESAGEVPDETAHAARSDSRLAMREALARLPDDNRVALVMSVVEGYSAAEVAEFMGKPVNTVYSLVMRGKEKLRDILGETGQVSEHD